MKLEQSFEVQAPLERVWQALIDVERVAPCLPGAEVTGRNDDGTYNGSFKVKIGPTAAAYTGKLHMQEVDEEAHRATMDAQGTDRRGQGGAKATIISSVAPAGKSATKVTVDTDYHITGRLARFGRGGMIEEISNRLLGEFARNLQDMLAHDGGDTTPTPGASAQTPSTRVEGQAAVDDTLEAPARESGEATAETLAEAARKVAAAGDPSTTETPDAAAAGAGDGMPAGVAADEPAPIRPDAETPTEVAEAPAEVAEAPAEVAEAPPAPADALDTPSVEPAAAADSSVPVEPPVPSASAPAPAEGSAEAPRPQSTWTPPASQSEGIDGLALVRSVLLDRIKGNPIPAVALLLGFLLAMRVLRRGDS